MIALQIIGCLLLFTMGHLFRDGWPTTGHTNFGARPGGGAICTMGSLLVALPWHLVPVTIPLVGWVWFLPVLPLAVGGAVFVGFWTDSLHGAGQGADKPIDILYLTVSGVTSLIPLGVAAWFLVGHEYVWVVAAGLIKAPIWYSMYAVHPERWYYFFIPPRISAMIFGAVVGGVSAFLLV